MNCFKEKGRYCIFEIRIRSFKKEIFRKVERDWNLKKSYMRNNKVYRRVGR